jgi:hypothetical protein
MERHKLWKDVGNLVTEARCCMLDKRRFVAAPRIFLRVCCNRSRRGGRAFTGSPVHATYKQPQVDVRNPRSDDSLLCVFSSILTLTPITGCGRMERFFSRIFIPTPIFFLRDCRCSGALGT